MVTVLLRDVVLTSLLSVCVVGSAQAEIAVQRIPIEHAAPVLLLKGEFSQSDSPDLLAREVAATGAKVVTFDSDGGNVVSAMAFGKMIRSLGLSTFQLRAAQCASACTLAFVGGVNRQAEAGSIGVHQSSFSTDTTIEGHTAVAAVQAMTAKIITHFIEMGVDPGLLQLSLAIPSNDMRYLTTSEMQSYKVTWGTLGTLPDRVTAAKPAPATTATSTSVPVTAARQTVEQKALAFADAYYDEWSRDNGKALAFLEKNYAETVDFHGNVTPKATIMIQKREFAARWPTRAYSVRAGSARAICSDACRIDGLIDWFARRDTGGRVSSGTAEFTLVWDQRVGTIASEAGNVIETDKDPQGPLRLISQWQRQNSLCRGGSGDSPDTLAACDRREAIGAKLQGVGWCYGREGKYGYQMNWNECGAGSARSEAALGKTPSGTPVKRPQPTDFPIQSRLTGRTILPDFKGRDRDFNTFRTRIREGMRQGPNFAGRYTLIQIGCGTGCSFAIVADNQTGRPGSFPRGGEDNMYLDLDFRVGSRLVAAQWFDYDAGRCYLEFFDFDHGVWKHLSKTDIGDNESCYRTIKKNLN